MNRKNSGFTLVELLVVIAIVALLVSILLPALSKAQEQARIAACLANLHHIGQASQMYLVENENIFYEYWQGGPNSAADRDAGQGGIPANENVTPDHPDYATLVNRTDWRPINQFVKNYDLWKCPSDNGRVAKPDHWYAPVSAYEPHIWRNPKLGSSYLFNTAGIPGWWQAGIRNDNKNINNKFDRIRQPSQFVLFWEFPFWNINEGIALNDPLRVIGYGVGHGGAANFHEDYFEETSANLAMADGHAERITDFTGAGRRNDGRFVLVPSYGTQVK
jgi:prepilin-type N-terminal cleavage/methylation domain-containing protein/prepilin-type processing-associated H-X9-DG protein